MVVEDNPTVLYFAYGMNTNAQEMARRCPDSALIGVGWLENYALTFRQFADIEPAPDTRCWGVIWRLSPRDLEALDQLEGYPYHYTRFSTVAHTESGPVACLVYQMVDQDYESPPSQGYLNCVTEGYATHGVPQEQLDIGYRFRAEQQWWNSGNNFYIKEDDYV